MSLVTCNACGERMSHLLKVCPHCGHDGQAETMDAALQLQRRQYLGWRYRLRMMSYTSMTLTVAGIIVWWSQSGLLTRPGSIVSMMIAAGVLGYFITRAGLFWVAMKLRRVRKQINQLE